MKDFYSIQKSEGFKHIIEDRELFIYENNILLAHLNQNEIMDMLKALKVATRDFQNGFLYKKL